MNAQEILQILIQVVFVALGIMATVDFLRHKDAMRRDIALLFGSLAIPFLIQLIGAINPAVVSPWGDGVAIIALVFEPYLLLRLVRYLRSMPAYMLRSAIFWLCATVVVGILFGESAPLISTAVSQSYLIVLNLYAMVGFVSGALKSTDVTRQRLRFAAAGSGFLGLIFLIVLVANSLPQQQQGILLFAQLFAVACVITFYIAFVPPRWLRRTWQLAELRQYLLQSKSDPTAARIGVEASLNQLCQAANRAVAGIGADVIQWDESTQQWGIRSESGLTSLSIALLDDSAMTQQLWSERRSRVIYATDDLDPGTQAIFKIAKAQSLLVVPLVGNQRMWGLLFVFLRYRSLFIDDDLSLLELFAQQSTVLLENYRLIDELREYSEGLEQTVAERTAALRRSEEQYRTIAKNFPNGSVFLFDLELRYIVADGTGLTAGGLSREQMEGKTIWEVYPQAYCDEQLEPLLRKTLAGELSPSEVQEGERVLLFIGVPVRDERGEVWAGMLITQDITVLKRAEEKVLLINAELEQRVTERTAQLMSANRELEAFSYSVSHDLRAPLRAVDGFSLALLEDYNDALDEMGRDFLNRIRTESQRMGQLIDDLIGLSRFTRAEMKLAKVDLSGIAREIAADLKAKEPDRAVEFSIQGDLSACADEGLISVVLRNLIGNAWKFTSKKPVAHIEFGCSDEAGTIEYYVRDNGAGFDMAYVNKLFGAFQRLHAMTEYAGTGIGLATVHRVVQRHAGVVRAVGTLNEGATFYFTLGANNCD